MKIPFSRPEIDETDIIFAVETLRSGWVTVGPMVKKFEEALELYTKSKNVVALDSCTSALTLAGVALKELSFPLQIIEYPTVVIPALTFVATANSFYHAGYKVSFCDVKMDGNIDADLIPDTSEVVVPVHFSGQVCDLKAIRDKSIFVIEDAAHAIGAKYEGWHVGTTPYSDGACFSFYPTKNMTTIEGGAFITRQADLANYVRKLSLHGLDSSHIDRYERSSTSRPVVGYPGFKANMTDVEASIGISQLTKLDAFISRRAKLGKMYLRELSNKVQTLDFNGRDHVWHMFIILVDNRDEFVSKLKEKDIHAGIHYSPIIPAHPFYEGYTNYKRGQFPNAEYIADHCVSLPLFNGMTDDEQEHVIRNVKELL